MVADAVLASWRDTPARRAIVDFVDRVTADGGADFVAPADRVAVFDNDGTLWTEKPIPIQLDFTLFRLAELANADPSLRARQPFKAAIERDYRWLGDAMTKYYRGDEADLGVLMAAVESAFEGMSVEGFSAEVMTWLGTAAHPVLHRPYMWCAFVPMVELLRYLEANGFTTYIASGDELRSAVGGDPGDEVDDRPAGGSIPPRRQQSVSDHNVPYLHVCAACSRYPRRA